MAGIFKSCTKPQLKSFGSRPLPKPIQFNIIGTGEVMLPLGFRTLASASDYHPLRDSLVIAGSTPTSGEHIAGNHAGTRRDVVASTVYSLFASELSTIGLCLPGTGIINLITGVASTIPHGHR